MVGPAIQRELGTAYAVGVAACDRAVMPGERLVFLQGFEAEHDVVESTCAVGHVDLGDDAAKAEEAHAQAVVVGHGEDVDRLPTLRRAIRRVIERGGGVGRPARDHGRQGRCDRTGTRHVCAEFAVAAEARLDREVSHDISFPFDCHPLGWRRCMSVGTASPIFLAYVPLVRTFYSKRRDSLRRRAVDCPDRVKWQSGALQNAGGMRLQVLKKRAGRKWTSSALRRPLTISSATTAPRKGDIVTPLWVMAI
jgi:hypothetical protein